jgi:hypothetical protein
MASRSGGNGASGVLIQAREWEWQANDLIQQVCLRAVRGLTQVEWSRHVAIGAYNPICQASAP